MSQYPINNPNQQFQQPNINYSLQYPQQGSPRQVQSYQNPQMVSQFMNQQSSQNGMYQSLQCMQIQPKDIVPQQNPMENSNMMGMLQNFMQFMMASNMNYPSQMPIKQSQMQIQQIQQPPNHFNHQSKNTNEKLIEQRFTNSIDDMKNFYNMQQKQDSELKQKSQFSYNGRSLFWDENQHPNIYKNSVKLPTKSEYINYEQSQIRKQVQNKLEIENEFISNQGTPFKESQLKDLYDVNKENQQSSIQFKDVGYEYLNIPNTQLNINKQYNNYNFQDDQSYKANSSTNFYNNTQNTIRSDMDWQSRQQTGSNQSQKYMNNFECNYAPDQCVKNKKQDQDFDNYMCLQQNNNNFYFQQFVQNLNAHILGDQKSQEHILENNNFIQSQKQNSLNQSLNHSVNDNSVSSNQPPRNFSSKLIDNFNNTNHLDDDRSIRPQKQPSIEQVHHNNFNQSYENPIDEQPIASNGTKKRFEDLIEEQLQKEQQNSQFQDLYEQDQVPKKQFLKRSQRAMLSNANVRSKAAISHIETIQEQIDPIQAPKIVKKVQKSIKQTSLHTSILQNQSTIISEFHPNPSQQGEKKKFLKRGEGKLGASAKTLQLEKPEEKPEKQLKSTTNFNRQKFNIDDDQPKYNENLYLFDDQEEWNEDPNSRNDAEEEISEPIQTRNKVVDKYFGGGKEPKEIKQLTFHEKMVNLDCIDEETEKKIVGKYMNDRIEELNREVQKFKLENERVRKMRSKYEEQLKQFNKQRDEFQNQKENELEEIEELKKEEMKKIRNEKKIQERNIKQLQNVPNRKERDEIDDLKKEIYKLKDDIKAKDQRYKLAGERMKKQIDELVTINKEQSDEIKQLEYLRLELKQQQKKQQPGLQAKSTQNLNIQKDNFQRCPEFQLKITINHKKVNKMILETKQRYTRIQQIQNQDKRIINRKNKRKAQQKLKQNP